MYPEFKKYLSILFLLIFLFPIVEKQIHEFEHRDDVHCSAADKHFHELEHSCSLCDQTIIDSTYPLATDFQLIISFQPFLFHPFVESIHAPDAFQYLPARAPPIA